MANKNKTIYPIGTKVYKISGNPFKSGFKVGTVTGVVTNEQDPKKRPAYTFEEDDSIVNCELCKTIEEHVPATLIDTRVGDTLYVIDDKYDIKSYVSIIITDIKEEDDLINFTCIGGVYGAICLNKNNLKNSIFVGRDLILATTKSKLFAAFINECTNAISNTEDDISRLKDKISNLYRGISCARSLKNNKQ